MQKLPSTKSCFVCGTQNPIGLRLAFETDGLKVQTRFVPTREHVGFQGVVHGGIISTLLDEIMVWACCARTRRFAYCAELNVRFSHPAKPGEELLASAELVSNRRNKLFEAHAELINPADITVATAVGKYLAIGEEEARELMSDLEDDIVRLLDRFPFDESPSRPG